MLKFEIGKEYETSSICDSNCKIRIKVIKRTDKTVTFEYQGETTRRKLNIYENEEYFKLGNYSMAPVFNAKDLLKEEVTKPAVNVDEDMMELINEFQNSIESS